MPPIAEEKLAIYAAISRLPFPQSYSGKIFLAAFLGTHVPLLSLIGYYILGVSTKKRDTLRVLTVAIAATLAGTAATLYALGGLLKPVSLASETRAATSMAANLLTYPPTSQIKPAHCWPMCNLPLSGWTGPSAPSESWPAGTTSRTPTTAGLAKSG